MARVACRRIKRKHTADPTQTHPDSLRNKTPRKIIKRQWGFYFICTKKGIKRASADVGLMFTAFNLRRLINIIDKNLFKQFLKELASLYFVKSALLKLFAH